MSSVKAKTLWLGLGPKSMWLWLLGPWLGLAFANGLCESLESLPDKSDTSLPQSQPYKPCQGQDGQGGQGASFQHIRKCLDSEEVRQGQLQQLQQAHALAIKTSNFNPCGHLYAADPVATMPIVPNMTDCGMTWSSVIGQSICILSKDEGSGTKPSHHDQPDRFADGHGTHAISEEHELVNQNNIANMEQLKLIFKNIEMLLRLKETRYAMEAATVLKGKGLWNRFTDSVNGLRSSLNSTHSRHSGLHSFGSSLNSTWWFARFKLDDILQSRIQFHDIIHDSFTNMSRAFHDSLEAELQASKSKDESKVKSFHVDASHELRALLLSRYEELRSAEEAFDSTLRRQWLEAVRAVRQFLDKLSVSFSELQFDATSQISNLCSHGIGLMEANRNITLNESQRCGKEANERGVAQEVLIQSRMMLSELRLVKNEFHEVLSEVSNSNDSLDTSQVEESYWIAAQLVGACEDDSLESFLQVRTARSMPQLSPSMDIRLGRLGFPGLMDLELPSWFQKKQVTLPAQSLMFQKCLHRQHRQMPTAKPSQRAPNQASNQAPNQAPSKTLVQQQDSLGRKSKCEDGQLVGEWTQQNPASFSDRCCKETHCFGCAKESSDGKKCIQCMAGYTLRDHGGWTECILCDDEQLYQDSEKRTCHDYQSQSICSGGNPPGDNRPYNGLKPSDACCACGGGTIQASPVTFPLGQRVLYNNEVVSSSTFGSPVGSTRNTVFQVVGDLSPLKLHFDANHGTIEGTTPPFDESTGSLEAQLQIVAFQDLIKGISSTVQLDIEIQPMSYGPKVLVFALEDEDSSPKGTTSFQLKVHSSTLNDLGQNPSYSLMCVPTVAWLQVDASTGALSYKVNPVVDGNHDLSDQASCTVTATGGTSDAVEVATNFGVARYWVWRAMMYEAEAPIVARKGRLIPPISLKRVPPEGFSVFTKEDENEGEQELWFKKDGEKMIKVPPAVAPEVLDVKCEGLNGNSYVNDFKWSRTTGLLTLQGQAVLTLDPVTGQIFGETLVELPQRLGKSFVELKCHVAATSAIYDTILTTSFQLRIEDDTCFFEKPFGQMFLSKKLSGKSGSQCQVECRKRQDCGAYAMSGSFCLVQTSNREISVSDEEVEASVVDTIYVRALCEEETACLDLVDSTDVAFLEGKYCPKGVKSPSGICSRAIGNTGSLKCSASGPVFLLFTTEPKQSRFGQHAAPGSTEKEEPSHFLEVQYSNSEHKWKYYDSTSSTWKDFAPNAADVLVAKIEQGSVEMLTVNSWHKGIHEGYAAAGSDFRISIDQSSSQCTIEISGRFLTAWNCKEKETVVYSRDGQTAEDEFIMAHDVCPLDGRYGSWVMRRFNRSDAVTDTGEVELRGDIIACFAEDFVSGAFEHGRRKSTLWLKDNLFSTEDQIGPNGAPRVDRVYQGIKGKNDKNELSITASLRAQECQVPFEEDTEKAEGSNAQADPKEQPPDPVYVLGTLADQGFYTLDACECFGDAFRDVAPVTDEARSLVPEDVPSRYNSFPVPPVLLFEGPFVCNADAQLIGGFLAGLDEEGCKSKCLERSPDCKFFLHVPAVSACHLLKNCERLGLTEPSIVHKLFGVLQTSRDTPHCVIADSEACWAQKMRRELLEDKLSADDCAFASVLSQCDTLHLLSSQQSGTCSKCVYFKEGSSAYQGRRKVPMPTSWPPASQISVSCNSRSRLMSATTRGQIAGYGVLTCLDGTWRNPAGDVGLSQWNCASCVQVAQADYATRLVRSMPEAYYIERRKAKYHFGDASDASLGCKTASYLTAAPLKNGDGVCLSVDPGRNPQVSNSWRVGVSSACEDRWYMTPNGGLAPERFPTYCLSARRSSASSFEAHLRLCSQDPKTACDQTGIDPEPSISCVGDLTYFFDRAGRLRNAYVDGRNRDFGLSQSCLTSYSEGAGRLHFLECDASTDQTWYFDGGDCHFTQRATSEMRAPLRWTYVLGENVGARLRADTDTKVEQEMSLLRKSMNRYSFGSCRANFLLNMEQEIENEQLPVSLNMRDGVNQVDLDEKYIRAYHVGSATSTLFTCPVEYHGGLKQFQAIKERIEALKTEIADMEGGCTAVQWEAQSNSAWRGCSNGCLLGEQNKVLTMLVSDRSYWRIGLSTLSQEDVEHGVRFGEYRPPLPAVLPPPPQSIDTIYNQVMECQDGFAASILRRSTGDYNYEAKWEVTCVEIKGLDKTRPVVQDGKLFFSSQTSPVNLQLPTDRFIIAVFITRWSYYSWEWGPNGIPTLREIWDWQWEVRLGKFCKDTTEVVKEKKKEIEDLQGQLAAYRGASCATNVVLPPEFLGQLQVAFQGNDQGHTVEFLASAKCHRLSTGEVPLENLTFYSFTAQQFLGIVRDTQYTMRMTDKYKGEPFEIVAKEGPAEFAEYGWFAHIDGGATVWGIWCPSGSVVATHDRIGDGSPHCIEVGSEGEDVILTQQLPASTRCPEGYAVSGWYNLPGLAKVVKKTASGSSGPKIPRGFTVLCRAVPQVSSLCELRDAMCEENDVIAGFEYTAENSLKYRCCKIFRPVGVIFQPNTGLEKINTWEGYYCPVHYDLSGRPSYELDSRLERNDLLSTNSDRLTAGTEGPGITSVGITVVSQFFETFEKTLIRYQLQELLGPDAECTAEGAVMSQWRVALDNAARMRIKYTCVTSLALGNCSATTKTTPGRVKAECSQGTALKRWRLIHISTSFEWTFEQTCCEVPVEQTVSQFTKEDETTGQNLRNLANIDLTCALGTVMRGFEIITRNGGVTVNATWFCLTLAPPQSQFVPSSPRNLAPVTQALWNLERHESGSLGQRCPGGSVMTQFQALQVPVDSVSKQLLLQALDKIGFSYTCMSPGLDAAGVYGLGSQGCRSVSTEGSTEKWKAGCNDLDSSSEAISSWKVVTDGTGATHIEYTCCAINQPSSTVVTERKGLWTVLDSSYSCSPGEALQSFELKHEGGSDFERLTYKCVTIKTARRLPDMVSSNQGGRLQWDPFLGSWMLEPSEVIQIIQPVKMETGFVWNSACPTQFTVEGWRFELFGHGRVNLLLTCRKVAHAVCDAEFTEQTDQKLECKKEDSKAMGSLQFTSTNYPNSLREVFDTKTQCCEVPLEPSEAVCERRQTAKMLYDGGLDLQADSIWAELHMAVDCQGKALTSFEFIWSETGSAATSDVAIEYRCCSLEPYREQLAGLHSAASRPQDVVTKVADAEQAKQERGRRAENRNIYEVVVEVQYAKSVEFKLDGHPYKFNGVDSMDFHWLVLDPFTHHFKGNYHMKHGDMVSDNSIVTQLRDLPAGSVVIIGTSAVTQFSATIQFALHSLGSRRPLQFDAGRAFAMVGVVPDYGYMPKVLGEESHPSAVHVEASVPHVFSVAPIANFEASYVQSVQKKDLFPAEKPIKPELASLKSVEPEFDPFCDLQLRTDLQSVNCELQPCPEEGHPCHHTYQKKVDEANFWDLTQRDIDRAYLEGWANVAEKKLEKDIFTIDKTFEKIKLGGQIAAAFVAAFAPGSHGVTADKTAEKAGNAAEAAEKGLREQAQKVGDFLLKIAKGPGERAFFRRVGRRIGKVAKLAKPVGAVAKFVGDKGAAVFKKKIPPKQPEKPTNKFDTSSFSDLPEVLRVPQPKKAPAWEENLKQFAVANYMDDNPIQTGLSKIMCDLYCTESAVKESSNAILESMQSTALTLQDNLQKLMDYHSQLIFYGLGQLREDLVPNPGALAQEEAELKEADAASSVKSCIESELKKLPTLKLNIDPSASSIKTMQWLKDAGQDLLNSVATILTHTAYSNSRNASALNASDTLGTLTSVRSLVENFLAVKELQFGASAAANKKISQPNSPLVIQETTSKKLKVVDKYLMQHEHELKTAVTFLTSVKSTEKLFSLPSLGDVATSLASMRWSSLVTAFTEAHQKHSVFTDSRARALSAAREALRMAEAYIHCKGHSIADLQLQWQRAMRLHDDSGTLLLQAWASTIAAHETLDSALQSHLLQELAGTAAVGDVSSKECLSFDSLVQFAHFHGVQAVERALAPVLIQVMALDAIGLHQEKELKRMKLEVSAKRDQFRLDDVVWLLGDIGNRSAEPGPDSLQLAARVLNVVGSQICPASRGDRDTGNGAGRSMAGSKCSQQGLTFLDSHWAVAKPGDLITSTSPGSALLLLTSCQDEGAQDTPDDTMQVAQGKAAKGQEQKDQKDQKHQGSEENEEVKKEADHGKRKEETGGKETGDEKPERIRKASQHKRTEYELLESIEMLLQGKPLGSSETNLAQTSSSSVASAQRELAHLCGQNCAEKFQSKLESQTSFLREFAELWISRPFL